MQGRLASDPRRVPLRIAGDESKDPPASPRTIALVCWAFLLGSGISVDAGMPRVAEISEQVFSGRNAIRHSDATYYIVKDGATRASDFYRSDLEATVAFTTRLREMSDRYFSEYIPDHRANYEDVSNFTKQIEDAISGEYENAALAPLLAQLRAELNADASDLMQRASECRNYIYDTVWRLLTRPVQGVTHLRSITDACRHLGAVDLFDLNHDPVLEAALAEQGIDAADGFGPADGDVRYWADCFERPVRHFKLHGSIDWFRRPLPAEPWRGSVVARSTTHDPYHEDDGSGAMLDFPSDVRPVILVGTFDKPLAYDSSVFADQHFHFHESLRRADRVVAIGYGFADKGINTRLIGWLLEMPNRRLVVVHGDEEQLLEHARFAIKAKWRGWQEDGRLRIVPCWVRDATWHDIDVAAA